MRFWHNLLGNWSILAYIILALHAQPALAQTSVQTPPAEAQQAPVVLPENADIKLCPALADPALYNNSENSDFAIMTAADDGYLYLSRVGLKFRFRLTDRTKDSYRRLSAGLKHYGSNLVIAMQPTRGMVIADKLRSPERENFKKDIAKKNYLKMLDEFRLTGIAVADMSDADTVQDYFRKTDNHWTRAGAKFTADKTAEVIKALPFYKDLEKTPFRTSENTEKTQVENRFSQFVNRICGTNYPDEFIDSHPVTTRADAADTENDLFAEEKQPELVLVGTSNSVDPRPSYANFAGFLKENLQADIGNEAVSGGNLEGAILHYLLTSKFKEEKPKAIIWEMSAHYGFNQLDFLREIVPAVHGECADKDALETASGDVTQLHTALFSNLKAKNYKSHDYYVFLRLDDLDQRAVKLQMIHADGKNDGVKFDRSLRVFPDNPGVFYAEISDLMETPLNDVYMDVKKATGTYKAKLCQVPKGANASQEEFSLQKNTRGLSFIDGVSSAISKKIDTLNPKRKYEFTRGEIAAEPIKAPVLPDTSGYTKQAILKKLPATVKGNVSIGKMKGSPPLRLFVFDKRLAEMQAIQDSIEPEAIHVYSGIYNLVDLIKEINDPDIFEEADDAYILRMPIAVYPNAALILKDLKKPLLMSQDYGAFIVSTGDMFILDSTIKGWNEKEDKPAQLTKKMDNFRPFITMWDGSELYIADSTLENMGYSLSKSYGLSLSTNEVIQEEFAFKYGDLEPPTGWIIDSHFHNFYFGFYSYEAVSAAILRNVYTDNAIYGIDPHDRSDKLIIAYNKVSGSKKKHGIIMSREVNNSFIFNNEVWHNKGSGIMLDRNCENTVIANNYATQNEGDGITVYESPHNLLYNNRILRNKTGGYRIRNSQDVRISGGENMLNKDFAFIIYEDPLTHTDRDFQMDPITTRSSAVISNVKIENNGGLLKSGGLQSVRFENIDLDNVSLKRKLFGGDLVPYEEEIGKLIKGAKGFEVRKIDAGPAAATSSALTGKTEAKH